MASIPPAVKAALDAGDANAFAPFLKKYEADLPRLVDPKNTNHRRAILGAKASLAKRGHIEHLLLEVAIRDESADGQRLIDQYLARVKTGSGSWAATTASMCAEDAPATSFALFDRLLEIDSDSDELVECVLNTAQSVGWKTVDRKRLEQYWDHAVALPDAAELLQPYVASLAPILGRTVPVSNTTPGSKPTAKAKTPRPKASKASTKKSSTRR